MHTASIHRSSWSTIKTMRAMHTRWNLFALGRRSHRQSRTTEQSLRWAASAEEEDTGRRSPPDLAATGVRSLAAVKGSASISSCPQVRDWHRRRRVVVDGNTSPPPCAPSGVGGGLVATGSPVDDAGFGDSSPDWTERSNIFRRFAAGWWRGARRRD